MTPTMPSSGSPVWPAPPSGVALFAPSTLTENAGSYVIPMAVVNGPANAEAVARVLQCGRGRLQGHR